MSQLDIIHNTINKCCKNEQTCSLHKYKYNYSKTHLRWTSLIKCWGGMNARSMSTSAITIFLDSTLYSSNAALAIPTIWKQKADKNITSWLCRQCASDTWNIVSKKRNTMYTKPPESQVFLLQEKARHNNEGHTYLSLEGWISSQSRSPTCSSRHYINKNAMNLIASLFRVSKQWKHQAKQNLKSTLRFASLKK